MLRWLRAVPGLLVALVAVLGVAVAVPSPAAAVPDWADPGAARVVAREAAKVGTKAAPFRAFTCGSLVGLVGCSAAAGAMLWLDHTESGQAFKQDVKDEVSGWLGRSSSRTNFNCKVTAQPQFWAQHSVTFTASVEHVRNIGSSSCFDYLAMQPVVFQIHATCMSESGSTYANTVSYRGDSNLANMCNLYATDWLVGAEFADNTGAFLLTNPGWYPNPVWNGFPGGVNPDDPDTWDDLTGAQTRVTLRCLAADGSTFNHVVTVEGSQVDPAVSCPSEGVVIGRAVDVLRKSGRVVTTMYDVDVTPEALGEYPECFTAGAWCDMAVAVDGILCTTDNPTCANWWDLAQQSPGRVSCVWGPYTLGYGDCRELQNAYVSPDGAWYPPDLAPGAPPIPYYPTNPDYRPAPPQGNGADPSWLRPEDCPPVATSVSQYGLQPIAQQALRCFLTDHPDFTFTSGHRAYQHFGQVSDHPHGLALDLAPPAWDTPAGNQRGWDAVAYWVWNSPRLGVRYVIFDGRIWWPNSGWHVYVDPDGNTSPHRDHVHVSLDPHAAPTVYRPPSPAPSLPYPAPQPDPEAKPPTNPPTSPPTTGDPDVPPGTGDPFPPLEGTNCDGSELGWNPASWVIVPFKCLFIPSRDVMGELDGKAEAFADTGIGSWLSLPVTVGEHVQSLGGGGAVPMSVQGAGSFGVLADGSGSSSGGLLPDSASGADRFFIPSGTDGTLPVDSPPSSGAMFTTSSVSTMGAGCEGPSLVIPLDVVGADPVTLHPFAACTSPMSTIATITKASLAISLHTALMMGLIRMGGAMIGMQSTLESMGAKPSSTVGGGPDGPGFVHPSNGGEDIKAMKKAGKF